MRWLLSVIVVLCVTEQTLASIAVDDLRCEWAANPLGVDVVQPRLGWKISSDQNGEKQTAYQIIVSSSADGLSRDLGGLWDSGIVKSDQTNLIHYGGKALDSAQQVFWKVRSWDKDGKPSAWSQANTWTMGLLKDSDWVGYWIGAASDKPPVFRRQLDVKPGLQRAVAFVCGLGQYEMSIDGKKVGDDLLTPGWTDYRKTCLYDSYDVTAMFQPGANAIGVILGNGMYNVAGGPRYTKFKGTFGPQKMIAQIRLEYADGAVEQIGTDDRWRVTTSGPITYSDVYGGEDFDATKLSADWNQSGFDDSKWSHAAVVHGPGGALRGLSCAAPAIRAIDVLKPVTTRGIRPGSTIYDLGQNASLMLRMTVRGPKGSTAKVTPAELVKADGSLDRGSVGGGQAYWKYTLAGSGSESYFSKFFYHGARYLQVDLTPAAEGGELPTIESIEGVVAHSSAQPIGEFACSNELFNRIRTLIRWAQRSNTMSVLTDCPHRERLGWLEQDYLNGPSLRYETDLAQFFTKPISDMSDAQLGNGLVPGIAPEYAVFDGAFRDSPEWGSALVQCAWQQYEWTGDVDLLARHYEGMKRYAAYLKSKSTDGIVNHGLGDWYDLGPKRPGFVQLTPVGLTATATYYSDIVILQKAAALLGKMDESKAFENEARQVREVFNRTFFNSETHQYATGSQTANAMAVALGLAELENVPKLVDALVNDVQKSGLTAGDVGYCYLLRALAAGGRSDVIFDMNNQSDRPGYGFQLKKGATSLTEGWGGQSSQNHFMLGHIIEWFYHDLAGIQRDPAEPGFKKIIIKPTIVGDLTWVKASFNSVQGKITSEWKIENGHVTVHVNIPANTTATVFMPGKGGSAARHEVVSGDHTFTGAI